MRNNIVIRVNIRESSIKTANDLLVGQVLWCATKKGETVVTFAIRSSSSAEEGRFE